MSTSESFVQALVDFSAEAPVAQALQGIEAQQERRRATRQRGISRDTIWTPRDVIRALEEYRGLQAAAQATEDQGDSDQDDTSVLQGSPSSVHDRDDPDGLSEVDEFVPREFSLPETWAKEAQEALGVRCWILQA